jgi:ABC-type glutathione transport system ATPase component
MVIEVRHVSKRFQGKRGASDIAALEDVSLTVESGETFGIVGESGSGKSTLARIMLGLIDADAGEVEILGRRIDGASRKQLRAWRADVQIVLQNAQESLNPRMRVGRAIAEPLVLHTDMDAETRAARVRELLKDVQLSDELGERHPHQLSGGQQQRVNIARAIATNPKVVVFDEPTSGLDVSLRADLLRLLRRIQAELALTYVMISHDLPAIRRVCDRVAVMYRGRIVETGPAMQLFENPTHAYTKYLIGAELPIDPTASLPAFAVPDELKMVEEPLVEQ